LGIAGTGQAMMKDAIRMAFKTLTYACGYKLTASDALAPAAARGTTDRALPSRAHRI
jgi:hypothetical protein